MKIISGGQTGVDRAALDAAIAAGFPIGGWCPKGRKAEDGVIDQRYALTETPLAGYAQRTEWNVRDSDGTLIFYRTKIKGGTLLTLKTAERYGSSLLVHRPGKIKAYRIAFARAAEYSQHRRFQGK